jgi:hypothetical protein
MVRLGMAAFDLAKAKKWAFAVVPAVGVLELVAHLWQTTAAVVPESDWRAARELVKGKAKAEDLVIFAPKWVDPVGRETFGDEVATLEREAFPDVTRFPRAFEVSIRGKHRDELASWREVGRDRVGGITITTLENPAPIKILDDLVTKAIPQGMSVQRVDGPRELDCAFQQGGGQAAGLGFGMAIPNARFVCSGGGFVGVSVLEPIDYQPHKCIYAAPIGGASVVRVRFANIAFGKALHGHHGLYSEHERGGSPVALLFKAEDKTLGRVVHNDGDGWKGFELDTRDLEGKRGELVAEITSQNATRRQYCFEADTR